MLHIKYGCEQNVLEEPRVLVICNNISSFGEQN